MDNGTNVPSTKLTAVGVATLVVAVLGRLAADRFGWTFSDEVIDLASGGIALALAYFVPELAPAKSAVRALRRRT